MKFIKLFPFEETADALVEAEPIHINVNKITSIGVYDDIFDEKFGYYPYTLINLCDGTSVIVELIIDEVLRLIKEAKEI